VTEYLPVSSTGHLILTAWALGLDEPQARADATNSFNIIIQSGAILAVLGLYWPRVKQMALGLLGRDGDGLRLAINLVIAFLPAAVTGPLFAEQINDHLFTPWPVVGALFVGAWLMLAVAYGRRQWRTEHKGRDLDHITWQIALLIGCGQCFAMWPGTSRSMITIVAALMLGLRPRAAAEFSFLLGLITLSAATGYKVVFDGAAMMAQLNAENGNAVLALCIGVAASAVSAALAVKWFVGFVTRHGVAPFGWYRLVLASVLAALIALGWVTIPSNGSGADGGEAAAAQMEVPALIEPIHMW